MRRRSARSAEVVSRAKPSAQRVIRENSPSSAGWCGGWRGQTAAAGSRLRDEHELPGRWPLPASARRTSRGWPPGSPPDPCSGRPMACARRSDRVPSPSGSAPAGCRSCTTGQLVQIGGGNQSDPILRPRNLANAGPGRTRHRLRRPQQSTQKDVELRNAERAIQQSTCRGGGANQTLPGGGRSQT